MLTKRDVLKIINLCSLFVKSHLFGNPVITPMFFHAKPGDQIAYYIDNQMFWGSDLLIVPALSENQNFPDCLLEKCWIQNSLSVIYRVNWIENWWGYFHPTMICRSFLFGKEFVHKINIILLLRGFHFKGFEIISGNKDESFLVCLWWEM